MPGEPEFDPSDDKRNPDQELNESDAEGSAGNE